MTHLESTACLLCGANEPEEYLRSRVQLSPATAEWFRFQECRRCGLEGGTGLG